MDITKVIINYIVKDLNLKEENVSNTIALIKDGATVPFISRYRKERTGGLNEIQVQSIALKYEYYKELEERKEVILKSISQQGKLTDKLKEEITNCYLRQRLEDLYLPYKPKRRTKATVAKEKGLEALADIILKQERNQDKQAIVEKYINKDKGVESYAQAIEGALDIIAEKLSEDINIREALRSYIFAHGIVSSKALKEWVGKRSKFEMYYNFSDSIKKIPHHRVLAIKRGAKEDIISFKIEVDEVKAINLLEYKVIKDRKASFIEELYQAIKDSYRRLLLPSITSEVFMLKWDEAQEEAIRVFSKNLKALLLAPPAGHKVIMGVDPGFRTGCKLAVIDSNGNFKEYYQIYLDEGKRKESDQEAIIKLIKKHKVELIAIGNGTASKETFSFIKETIDKNKLDLLVLLVSEAGASVYSASGPAIKEFPNLDVTIRGAISIARRLQDPLSELVKIDPKSIGVGQYQHDVNQGQLKKSLDFVVESCVNYVGVNINTASLELLTYVSGIGQALAKNIIDYRTQQGQFTNKKQLLQVPRFSSVVFEQSAGFLRIIDGDNPLDNSGIHPESYYIVEKMAKDKGVFVKTLIGDEKIISGIELKFYMDDKVGKFTLQDIIKELKKPGLDPRKQFDLLSFNPNINNISDLGLGMILEGIITNVTDFGAFVDIGVHREGLIHISHLSDKYIKTPYEVVSVGDKVKVKVITLDKELERIGLEVIKSDLL